MHFLNPVIPGFHPDPSICRVGGDYFLVTSSFHYFPGVPLFHSRDLVHWRQISHCLTRVSQLPLDKVQSSGGIYAPTIRYNNGRFYMTTSNNGNFYVWTDNPYSEWSDPVYVEQDGIDSSLLFDASGKVYFTSSDGLEGSGIYQCEIDIGTGKKLSETRKIWNGTGGTCPEGPHLYSIKGYYYLMIAEGGTEYGHMETIARSRNPYGPFEACPYNPILSQRSTGNELQSTGHADLVQTQNGDWWAVFLGVRPVGYPPKHHLGRETFLAPVHWTEDEWPIIGDRGLVGLELQAPKLPEQKWEENPVRDDFAGEKLQACWNFLRNPCEADWTLKEQNGSLTLRGSELTLDHVDSPAFLGRRQEHFHVRIATLLDFMPQSSEEAGLTVLMNERFHCEIGITHKEGIRNIIFRRRVASIVVENFLPVEEGPTELILTADKEMYRFMFAMQEEVVAGEVECCLLSTEIAGGFTGVYVGMYATGNGRRSETQAYFDWFDYEPQLPVKK